MELYLEPVRRMRDEHGRFVKNHPCSTSSGHTKSKKVRKNISKGLKKAFKEGRVNPPKYTGKKVVAVKDGEFLGCFDSATKLAEHLNVSKVNIIRVCTKKRKAFRGIQFFYEKDKEWMSYLNTENGRKDI